MQGAGAGPKSLCTSEPRDASGLPLSSLSRWHIWSCTSAGCSIGQVPWGSCGRFTKVCQALLGHAHTENGKKAAHKNRCTVCKSTAVLFLCLDFGLLLGCWVRPHVFVSAGFVLAGSWVAHSIFNTTNASRSTWTSGSPLGMRGASPKSLAGPCDSFWRGLDQKGRFTFAGANFGCLKKSSRRHRLSHIHC